MLFILPDLYGLPLQLHNKVFKFYSMKNYVEKEQKNSFQVFSMQKVTDMLSSNHHLSLYTKFMTVLNKEAKHEIKKI